MAGPKKQDPLQAIEACLPPSCTVICASADAIIGYDLTDGRAGHELREVWEAARLHNRAEPEPGRHPGALVLMLIHTGSQSPPSLVTLDRNRRPLGFPTPSHPTAHARPQTAPTTHTSRAQHAERTRTSC